MILLFYIETSVIFITNTDNIHITFKAFNLSHKFNAK